MSDTSEQEQEIEDTMRESSEQLIKIKIKCQPKAKDASQQMEELSDSLQE